MANSIWLRKTRYVVTGNRRRKC